MLEYFQQFLNARENLIFLIFQFSTIFPGSAVYYNEGNVLLGLTVFYMNVQNHKVPFNLISKSFKEIQNYLQPKIEKIERKEKKKVYI